MTVILTQPAHLMPTKTTKKSTVAAPSTTVDKPTRVDAKAEAQRGIRELSSRYKQADSPARKTQIADEMQMVAAEAVYELKAMGRELEETEVHEAIIEGIGKLKERAAFWPVTVWQDGNQKMWRESAVDELAVVLQAALEAMAVLAVECRSVQATKSLAWRSDLGRHRLPDGASIPLEEAIQEIGGEQWTAWQQSVAARQRQGKRLTRSELGAWALKLWKAYDTFRNEVMVDEMNRQIGFSDIPSTSDRWDNYRKEFDLPAELVPSRRDPETPAVAHFVDDIVMPLLRWMGANGQRQCAGKKCDALWDDLVGDSYRSSSGGPDWSKIRKQVLNALEG